MKNKFLSRIGQWDTPPYLRKLKTNIVHHASCIVNRASLTLLLVMLMSVNMWGADYTYAGKGTFNKQSSVDGDGYYVFVLTPGALTNSASSNYVGVNTSYTGTTDALKDVPVAAVLRVTSYTSGKYYILNNSGDYLYSSGDKKIAYSSTSQYWTVGDKRLKTAQTTVVNMGYISGSGFRPYTSTSTNATSFVCVYKLSSSSCTNKVTVTKNTATGGSYTLKAGSATGSEISNGGTVDNCDANATIVVIPQANTHYHCTGVIASNSANVTGPNGSGNYTITYTKGSSINSSISVSFAEDTKYTVNWYANGQLKGTQTNYSGTACTAPTTPTTSDCDGSKVFVGWTTFQNYESEDIAPSDLFTDPTTKTILEGGANYYAVFATESAGGGSQSYTKSSDSFTALTGNIGGDTNLPYTSFKGGASNDPEINGTAIKLYRYNKKTADAGGYIEVKPATASNCTITAVSATFSVNNKTTNIAYAYKVDDADLVPCTAATSMNLTNLSCTSAFQLYNYSTEQMQVNSISITYSIAGGTDYSGYITSCGEVGKTRISYNANTTAAYTGTLPDYVDQTNGQAYTVSDATLTRTGYTFVGWNTNADATEKMTTIPAADITGTPIILYAIWSANSYDVVFNGNGADGGTTMDNQSIKFDASADLNPNTYTRTGHTFQGWATTEDGQVVYADKASYTMNSTGAILYAVWKPNQHKITYVLGEGGSGCGNINAQNYGTMVTLCTSASKAYHTFAGWTSEDVTIVDNQFTMPDKDVTITATWTEFEKYTVTFKNNGELIEDLSRQVYAGDGIGKVLGVETPLPTLTETDACDPHSRTFAGWTESKINVWQDEAPTLVSASTTVTEALELNAVWAKEVGVPSTDYSKISAQSDLETNDYVIGYKYKSNGTHFVMKNAVNGSYTTQIAGVAMSPSNNKFTSPNAMYVWHFEKQSDGSYTIYNAAVNKYLSASADVVTQEVHLADVGTKFNVINTTVSSQNLWRLQLANATNYYVHGYSSGTTYYFKVSDSPEESNNPEHYITLLYKNESTLDYTDYITHSSSSPLESITLNTTGVKKNYFVGETFTSAHLSATAKLEDGIEFPVEHDALTIEGPSDLSTAGEKIVTVKYTFNNQEQSAEYKVNAYSVTVNSVYTDRVDDEPVTGNTYSWTPTTGALTFSTQAHYQFNGITNMVGADATGSDLSYTLSNPTADVTLTATWQRLFTLTYNGKGGSTPAAVVDKPSGTEITLSTPTWTGYDFVGWFDNEGYEGTALTSPYAITKDETLYAKWSEIMPTSITLSPDVTEITDLIYDDSNKKSTKITATVNPSTALEKTFTWSVVEGDDVVEAASDGTITAKAAGTAKVKVASTRDANIYKEISVTVHSLPQITWLNMDGSTFATSQGTSAGKVGTLPTETPTSCDAEKYPYFRGWSATNFGKTTDDPEANFITVNTPVELDSEYKFFAVCAAGEDNSEEYSFTIQTSDFNTTSYAANNGSHDFTAKATADNSKTKTIACTTNQIYQNNNSVMQWQKSNGYIYNTTDLGTIKSVVVNSSEGTFTTYYGTTAHPTSGTMVGNGYFTVQVGNAAGYTSSIVVTFDAGSVDYTTWATQCCTAWTPTLSYANNTMQVGEEQNAVVGTTHGTATYTSSNPSSVEVNETTGHIKAVGGGTATISVTWSGDDTYCEQTTTSQEITVNGTLQVSFNSNGADGGTAMEPQMVEYGVPTNLNKNTYTKTGYSFEGWAETSDATSILYTDEENVTFLAGVELFAVWSINAHKVTIQDVTGGTIAISPTTTTIDYNTTVTATATLTPGYNFVSWSATPAVTFADATSKSTTFSMPDADIKLTASYTPILVTKIDLKKGSEVVTALEFEKGVTSPVALTTAFTPADALDKTVEWHSGNTDVVTVNDGEIVPVGLGTAKVTATSTVVPSVYGSVTVTVYEWQDADPKYTLTNQPASTVYYETNKIDFANWTIQHNLKRSDDATKIKQETVASSDWTVTLGGVVIENKYTLTTADDGKALVIKVGETELYNQTLTVNEKAKHTYIDRVHGNEDKVMIDGYTIPALSNAAAATEGDCATTHYVFKGWVTEANADAPSDENLIAAGGSATAKADATFYAVWAEHKNVTEDKTMSYGWESTDSKTGWTISSNGTNSNYKHSGAKSGEFTQSTSSSAIWVNCIQTSSVIAKPKHIQCYYSKSSGNTNSSSYWAIETKPNSGSWTEVAKGKTFNNVTEGTFELLEADLTAYTNVIVAVNVKTTQANRIIDDVILTYEVTEPKDVDYITECVTRYELSFDANGGEGKVPETIKLKEGGKVALPGAELAKVYNDFNGWNTQADRQGTHYAVGDEYTMGGENATLYADWAPLAVTALEITSEATNTEFGIGQTFSADGLTVMATYEGGDTEENVAFTTNYDNHVFTATDEGNKLVTVSYKGFSADLYNITVAPALIVRFFVNGTQIQEKSVFDKKIGAMPNAMTSTVWTDPDNEFIASHYPVFAGWTLATNDENITFVNEGTDITTNVDVNAVFAKSATPDLDSKTLATSIDPSKRYVIVDGDYYYKGEANNDWGVVAETKAEVLTFYGKSAPYAIQQTDGKYFKVPSSHKFYLQDDPAYNFQLATVVSEYFLQVTTTNEYLRDNDANSVNCLRWYGTNNGTATYLYSVDVEYDHLTIAPKGDYARTDLVVGNYGTVCVPYAVNVDDRSGATFWSIETSSDPGSASPTSVTIVEETGALEAGKPYIFYAEGTTMAMFFSGDKYEGTESVEANGLYGNLTDGTIIINQTEYVPGYFFVLQQKLYECGMNCTVRPNRGWVQADKIEEKTTPSPAPRRVIGNPKGTPTGINDLNADDWKNIQGARKYLHNNHIIIVNEGRIFNAQGQLVK